MLALTISIICVNDDICLRGKIVNNQDEEFQGNTILPFIVKPDYRQISMDREKSIEELKKRRKWAEEMGGEEGVTRQHGQNRLTIRERIGTLVDRNSFQEV